MPHTSDAMPPATLPASFRDPSGFLYINPEGTLLRQINKRYQADFDLLNESGLYDALISKKWLVAHEQVSATEAYSEDAYTVIKPERIPFISYPYEWSFSALKDAALLTLSIQKEALAHGMSLKDASAYNVQFIGCSPIFIDTLSFEAYEEGAPWVAYSQFCRHFLAPLLLMAKSDVDLGKLSRLYIDGVPLDLAANLLPWKSRLSMGTFLHVYMQAKMLRKHESTSSASQANVGKLSKSRLLVLLDNLRSLVSSCRWKPAGTEWGDYYQDNSYTEESSQKKCELVAGYLQEIEPVSAWDLGANTGVFSRLAVEAGAYCCAWDIDPACVEKGYRHGRSQSDARLQPLLLDLTNPSPALGWAHEERSSFAERGPVDVVMALALIHHLAIANNVPLESVARFFSGLARNLIIEWVPKEDVQVQRLLRSREDIFDRYEQSCFETAFSKFYTIQKDTAVGNSGRVLYWMKTRDGSGND